jgi:hypothetical protein
MATLADYNTVFAARAEQYRTQAKVFREQAETVPIAMLRHELLQLADECEDLADSIEGLRFSDDLSG